MSIEEMARLHRLCFDQMRAWSVAEISEILNNKFAFSLCLNGAFLLGRAVAGEAEIITLAVDPAARRKGLGRALVYDFLRSARQRNAQSAFLEVAADNEGALALYAGCGFTPTGLRRAYYQRADGLRSDALILTCPLSQQAPAF